MKQIPLAIALDTAPSFDSFVIGANAMAVAHLGAMQAASPPVYLWGPSGSGKTHLLHALADRFQQRGLRVGWFSAADPAPWAVDDTRSLLVFDGFHRAPRTPPSARGWEHRWERGGNV